MNRKRVVAAMSGGVDSSVAAALLVEQGYDVVGVFMRTGAHAEEETCATGPAPSKIHGCCSALDAGDARRVADTLNIPFYALNFQDDFGRIQDYFVDEYLAGRTPNPCVVCNTWLKFGKLWEYADAVGAEWIATGHYARTAVRGGIPELRRGLDPAKDQSYFLFGLDRERLGNILFPIGDLQKDHVRELARQLGLRVHQKPDSQEICFVPSGNYRDVIAERRPDLLEEGGEIVDVDGHVLAEHAGISRFTIGQRKGLGIAVGEPRYVLDIVPESRRVVIGPRDALLQDSLVVERVNWLVESAPEQAVSCEVKIRHLHAPAAASVVCDGTQARVRFETPQSAVTRGQAAVFYQGERVLGGGWIR